METWARRPTACSWRRGVGAAYLRVAVGVDVRPSRHLLHEVLEDDEEVAERRPVLWAFAEARRHRQGVRQRHARRQAWVRGVALVAQRVAALVRVVRRGRRRAVAAAAGRAAVAARAPARTSAWSAVWRHVCGF